MKNLILFSLILASFFVAKPSLADDNECALIALPKDFTLDKEISLITTAFHVYGPNKEVIGTIQKDRVSFRTTFRYYTPHDELAFYAIQSFFSWGTEIMVYDCQDKLVGSIHKNVISSAFTSALSFYSIYDAEGKLVGKSDKTEILATNISINSAHGEVVRMHRPMLNPFGDVWELHRSNYEIDPRLWLTIGAFKSYDDLNKDDDNSSKKKNAYRSH